MKKQLTFLPIISGLLIVSVACSSDNSSDKNGEKEASPVEQSDADNDKVANGPFDIKSGIVEYEMKSTTGKIIATHKMYFENYGTRIRLEETIDGETSVFLFDDEMKKGLTTWAGRKPNKMSMRQGEINIYVAQRGTSGFMKQDNESILNRDCEVYANNAKTGEGDAMVTFWLHKGVALKETNHLGGGYTFEAVGFSESTPNASLFSELDALK